MQYRVRQEFFSLNERFTVNDGNERPRFQVESLPFSPQKTFCVYDVQGLECLQARMNLFQFTGEFRFYRCDREIGVITQKFPAFLHQFSMEILGKRWTIEGNIFGNTFSIFEGNTAIGRVEKDLFRIRDVYTLTSYIDRYDVYLLASLLCIDYWVHPKR